MNTSKNQLHTTHNSGKQEKSDSTEGKALLDYIAVGCNKYCTRVQNTCEKCESIGRPSCRRQHATNRANIEYCLLQRPAILQNKKKRQALFRLAEKLADRPRRRGRLSGLRDAGTGLRQTQRDPLGATSPKHDLLPKGSASSWRGNKEGGPGSSRRGSRQHDAG